MSIETEPYFQWHLRHGESAGNVGVGFGGGHPDDTLHGPVGLTELGKVQALASGLAAHELGLTIDKVFTSGLARAVATAKLFSEAYFGRDSCALESPIQGLHEVCHGLAERIMPLPTREEADEKFNRNVRIMGSLLTQDKYAGWFTPTGFGDGETYLEAGLRVVKTIEEQCARPNALIVGHNGGLRHARVLASHLSLPERRVLADQYNGAAETRQKIRKTIAAAQSAGNALTREAISDIFAPGAAAARKTAELLQAAGIPVIKDVIGEKRRIGNGQFVEVQVQPNGRWTILRRLNPILPEAGQPLPDSQTPPVEELPFERKAGNLPAWW